MRTTMKKTMLGAALAVGLLTAGAAGANAQPRGFYGRGYARPVEGRQFVGHEFVRPESRYYGGVGIAVGAPVVDAYVPPCPGDGYVWTAGYYNAGIWIPGAWNFRGRVGFDRGYGAGFRDNRIAANHFGNDHGFRGRR